MKNKKMLLPLNLQFFADGSDEGNNGGNDSSTPAGDNGNEKGNEDQTKSGEKTFTQEQVNAMMAKEKNEGKRSILKSLGFKNEEDAQDAIKKYNEYVEKNKTDEEKNQEKLNKAESDKDKALERAKNAENKLACFNAGISKDYIDDVLAIASFKVSDDKNIDDVLSDMKKDTKYSTFFGDTGNNGTGTTPGHTAGTQGNPFGNEYGKTLGSSNVPKQGETKSSYFN